MITKTKIDQIQYPSALFDLELLRSPDGALYASSGELYKFMVFGRDSLEAADDLLRYRPDISESVIIQLAQLQGIKSNSSNAEEYGKIPHQHMQLVNDGKRIPDSALRQMQELAVRWGGDENGFTYYGSLDATPLYARHVIRHSLVHGPHILSREFTNREGKKITVKESLKRALNWICDHLESSELDLLEFRRLKSSHLIFQSWRDSATGFMHEDGSQANLSGFIAPLEVQGYAYDALKLSAKLLIKDEQVDDQLIAKWNYYAQNLQKSTINRFWIEDRKQFAMGIDRDNNYHPKFIRTPASSQGVLLDSRLLLDLPEEQRQKYVSGVVTALYSPEFITDIGIRCRSVNYTDLVPFADYHGSQAVWTKESYDFSKGLRRQGFDSLADDIENRILNMINVSGENYEFLYVTPNGEVDYRPQALTEGMVVEEIIKGTNIPDKGQAWTVSASLGIKHKDRAKHHASQNHWSHDIEKKLQQEIAPAIVKSDSEIRLTLENRKKFAIDIEAGITADRTWNPDWWS